MKMGRLYYGNSADAIEISDRSLGYLRAIATAKLRRSESFTVSWRHESGGTPGRSTIWLHGSIPLRFEFSSAQSEPLDRRRLDELARAANSSAGVTIDLNELDEEPERGDHVPAITPARLGRAA
jgi:hypothetical protein